MATERTIPQYLVFDSGYATVKHEQKTRINVGVRFARNKKNHIGIAVHKKHNKY